MSTQRSDAMHFTTATHAPPSTDAAVVRPLGLPLVAPLAPARAMLRVASLPGIDARLKKKRGNEDALRRKKGMINSSVGFSVPPKGAPE